MLVKKQALRQKQPHVSDSARDGLLHNANGDPVLQNFSFIRRSFSRQKLSDDSDQDVDIELVQAPDFMQRVKDTDSKLNEFY